MAKDPLLALNIFLEGAKQTASLLDSEFTVTDNTTGKVLGGTGLIMARLIDQVEWSQKRVAELEAALLWIVTCPESVMDGGNGARRVAESVINSK